ncbi:type IV pilin protein [Elusimicrobium minutum]|uniref:type IV pilin protein n=1 Tax=Elusimicrobium minutum TaxID=423605 RepID=UPI0001618D43|nr:hypothetical protein [Elusimicrobium minutum]
MVIVLIIGILAAIAVLQYTKAVNKSRISALVIMAKTAKDAQNRYFLQHGNYQRRLGSS